MNKIRSLSLSIAIDFFVHASFPILQCSLLYIHTKFTDGSILQIRDGDTSEAPLLYNLCGFSLPGSVSSTGNRLWIRSRASTRFPQRGYDITYTSTQQGFQASWKGRGYCLAISFVIFRTGLRRSCVQYTGLHNESRFPEQREPAHRLPMGSHSSCRNAHPDRFSR